MVNIFHNAEYCSLCACESDDFGDLELNDTGCYTRCINKYAEKISGVSNKDAFALHFILLPLFNEDTNLELFIDPKTAVSDARNSPPPLCFVPSLTGLCWVFL